MSTAAARQHNYRQRLKAGHATLAVECNLVAVADALVAANLLEPTQADSREAITNGIEQLLSMFSEGHKS